MIVMRLRTKISDDELNQKVGKIITDDDFNAVLTGPAMVLKPDGRPLVVYLPGAVREHVDAPGIYDILHSLRTVTTNNRGAASGTRRIPDANRSTARAVPSAIVGAMDGKRQRQRYCRLTAWTGSNLPQWQALQPLLRHISAQLAKHVPDRYANQANAVQQADPAWVVPDTVFSTVTVNNTYPTGVHTDKGDLAEGFSTLACIRKGSYTGGILSFPRWRLGVNLNHGDMVCMDAHDWHGNTAIVCDCGNTLTGPCHECGAERISIVSYFRENMTTCGTPEEEYQRAAMTI